MPLVIEHVAPTTVVNIYFDAASFGNIVARGLRIVDGFRGQVVVRIYLANVSLAIVGHNRLPNCVPTPLRQPLH